jgi:hypothetical protein
MLSELVNSERLADDIDWSKVVEDLAQPYRIQVINFEIPILRLCAHQRITHTPTHQQRPATSIANGLCE